MSSSNMAGISKELLNGTAKESDSSKKEGEKVPEGSGKTGANSDAAVLDASRLEFMESIGEDVEDLEKKICQWRWHSIGTRHKVYPLPFIYSFTFRRSQTACHPARWQFPISLSQHSPD